MDRYHLGDHCATRLLSSLPLTTCPKGISRACMKVSDFRIQSRPFLLKSFLALWYHLARQASLFYTPSTVTPDDRSTNQSHPAGTDQTSIYHLPEGIVEPKLTMVYHLPKDIADHLEIPPGVDIHTAAPPSAEIPISEGHPSIASSPSKQLDTRSGLSYSGHASNVAYTLPPSSFIQSPFHMAHAVPRPVPPPFDSTHQGPAFVPTYASFPQTGSGLSCEASTVGRFPLGPHSVPQPVDDTIAPSPASHFAKPTVYLTIAIPTDNCGSYHGQFVLSMSSVRGMRADYQSPVLTAQQHKTLFWIW